MLTPIVALVENDLAFLDELRGVGVRALVELDRHRRRESSGPEAREDYAVGVSPARDRARTPGMADRYRVGMLMLHYGTPRDQEAREQLAEALPDDAEVTEPDDIGVFEVALDAEDREESLQTVWDAVAASGTDDHIVFLEHPELPEHWKRYSRSPQP